MMIIGGVDSTNGKSINESNSNGIDWATYNTQDPFTNGLGIFDISKLDFATSYDPSAAPYAQSDVVMEFYRYKCASLTRTMTSRF